MSGARLIIPDVHHKAQIVNDLRSNHPGMPAIFLGDYFDDFHDSVYDMEKTCRWLKQAFENDDDEFILGNHCFAYLSYELGLRWGFCTGWRVDKQHVFHEYFPEDTLLNRGSWLSRAGLSAMPASRMTCTDLFASAKRLVKSCNGLVMPKQR